ncbi:splicing factor 3B subunit 4 isoform X2 [Mangifera indica]|uniref:splicing factor 3B subunit 4 isoform X2 n=1 Tax=Mangifera indica TaxID=29780 RepID=UPI001CFA0D9C|nr:splicing factor 3B subunit 4 isoform X2 [Mangifera indica]
MSGNSRCNIYIGNLDERVSERVLYDILIQAGRVVDLYIPRDKETDKPKGYAFAEYESQEIADYAIKLFNGLVTLYNRTLRFAFSGQDKNSQNSSATVTPSSRKSRTDPIPLRVSNMEISPQSTRISAPFRISTNPASIFSPEEPPPPGVTVTHQSNEDGTHISGGNYECSRRVFGSTLDSINHSRSRRYDSRYDEWYSCIEYMQLEGVPWILGLQQTNSCYFNSCIKQEPLSLFV